VDSTEGFLGQALEGGEEELLRARHGSCLAEWFSDVN
jgi:hypothetical protein